MNRCVIGLQWGDEGKGKVVDILAEDSDVVVRYNGGANAGHTVVVGNDKFALHLLPSGSVRPRAICVITNAVVVDPEVLIGEIDGLTQKGISLNNRLFVSASPQNNSHRWIWGCRHWRRCRHIHRCDWRLSGPDRIPGTMVRQRPVLDHDCIRKMIYDKFNGPHC